MAVPVSISVGAAGVKVLPAFRTHAPSHVCFDVPMSDASASSPDEASVGTAQKTRRRRRAKGNLRRLQPLPVQPGRAASAPPPAAPWPVAVQHVSTGNEEARLQWLRQQLSALERLPAKSRYAMHRRRVITTAIRLLEIDRWAGFVFEHCAGVLVTCTAVRASVARQIH